jgi:hypothetical protein
MVRKPLQQASEILDGASETTDNQSVAERLSDQAEQFREHATADRGPDHGRLARHENALHEIIDDAEETVANEIDRAMGKIREYRETVDGV